MVSSTNPFVLHVIEPATQGGAESVVRSCATMYAATGRRVAVAAIVQSDAGPPLISDLRARGVPVHEVRCGRRKYRREARNLAAWIAREGADLVHTHVYHADLVGYLAARRCGVPVVATLHGFTDGGLKNRAYQALDLYFLRRFDHLIAVSDAIAGRAIQAGCRPGRLTVVPNGPSPDAPLGRDEARRILGLPAGAQVVGWVGRLSPEKGPDLFVRAMADGNALGVMIGDGPERSAVEALIRNTRLEQRVRLLGERPAAGTLMGAFDVLVSSSRSEGSPIGLLEGVRAGIPVVAFGVGGIPSILEVGGWVVPPNDVAQLQRAVAEVLADPAAAAVRASRGHAAIDERFGTARWIRALDEVYRKVMDGR